MASRTKQKEEARARRLAEERELAERAQQRRRLQMLGGVVLAAVAIVAVAIALSVSGGSKAPPKVGSKAASGSIGPVNTLLAGMPQSATTLGSPSAKVTVTEYGDLQCPVCRDFSETAEQTLISKDVREGKVRLVYKSLSTATSNGPNPGIFPTQQAAAYAAGLQNLGWYYILSFYRLQGQEGTNYVTPSFLTGIAHLVPGLDLTKWSSDRTSSTLIQQVNSEQQTATSLGLNSTPTLIVQGPKGQAQPIAGDVSYSALEQQIQLGLVTTDQLGPVSTLTRATPARERSDTDRRLRLAILVITVIGIGIASYLTYTHYAGIKVACLSSGGCETVQASQWSKLHGIPVAVLGLIGYVLILASLAVRSDLGRIAGFGLALVGFLFSMYLTYRELFSIHAICQWCVSSAVLITVLMILTGWRVVRSELSAR